MAIFNALTEPTPIHHFSYLTEVSILAKHYSWALSLSNGERERDQSSVSDRICFFIDYARKLN